MSKAKLNTLESLDGTVSVDVKDIVDVQPIGVGQTWQDMTAMRVLGTTYTNNTTQPIVVNFKGYNPSSAGRIEMYVGPHRLVDIEIITKNKWTWASVIVPAGETYRVILPGADHYWRWHELRETP